MKNILLLIAVIFSSSAFGQNDPATPALKKIQLGINFSPDIAYRTLSSSDNFASIKNDVEIPKFGYTGGLNIGYNLTTHVGLETGIQYSNKGFQTKTQNYITNGPDPSTLQGNKTSYTFGYLDVPVKVNLTLGKKKIRFFSSLGITTNILILKTVSSVNTYSDGHTSSHSYTSPYDFNTLNLSPTISAGVDYKINDKMNLRIEPTFRYSILPIISTSTVRLYSAGLNISYYFGL